MATETHGKANPSDPPALAAHDCGHVCCDERGDPHHDHFLDADRCPSCATAASGPKYVNLAGRWRTGRRVGRTIYAQQGPEPADDDPLIGVMDHPSLAALAVECRNRSLPDAT